MCSLYTTARETNRWPMKLFYGIIDRAALNQFVSFTENVPNIGEHTKQKRQNFLSELSLALFIPQSRQRFEVQQSPQDMNQVIRICGILPATSPAPSTNQRHSAQRKRWHICPRSKDKKIKFICNECNNFVCEDHNKSLCN